MKTPRAFSIETQLLAGFALITAVLALVSAAAWRNTLQTTASRDWVNHTHAVILETQSVLSSLHASEAALRDYLITRQNNSLAAYQQATARLKEHLQVTSALIASNPTQHDRVAQLQTSVGQRLAAQNEIVRAAQTDSFHAPNPEWNARLTDPNVSAIAQQVRQLITQEDQLLQQRDSQSNQRARDTRRILFAGLAVNFLLLAFSFFLTKRDLALRRQAAALLQHSNESLEAKVRERTADLTRANQALEVENLERQWATQATHRLSRHNELIVNSVPDGVFVLSRAGKILRVNPAGAQMSGYDPRALIGQPLLDFLEIPQPPRPDPFRITSKDSATLSGRAQLRRRDSSSLPILFTRQTLQEEGQIVCSVVTLTKTATTDPNGQ